MPETGPRRMKSAALRVSDMRPPSGRMHEALALDRGQPSKSSKTELANRRRCLRHDAAPLACFHVDGHQCEVVAQDALPDGREMLGSLVLGGRTYLVRGIAAEPDVPDLMDLLTPRELDIALLVAGGWDAKAIARRLEISFHTVRVHTGRIYAKLQMHKQSELVSCVSKQSWHRRGVGPLG